jgi:peptidoglycan-associated lipoprotein
MKKAALCIAAALVLAACASSEKTPDAPVTDRSGTTPQPPRVATAPPSTTTPTRPDTIAADPLKDPKSPLSKRSVFFDFDSNVVKDEYRGLVQAHSRYLTNDKRDARIRIEGNADERGSREYNLALGQRRAESVKKVMSVLGVQDNRIETISFGEEKPMAQGHDEDSWARNRRADIKYAGE